MRRLFTLALALALLGGCANHAGLTPHEACQQDRTCHPAP